MTQHGEPGRVVLAGRSDKVSDYQAVYSSDINHLRQQIAENHEVEAPAAAAAAAASANIAQLYSPAGASTTTAAPVTILGRGSFGTVVKVRRNSDGVVFAAKLMQVTPLGEREVGIHKGLQHVSLVRLVDTAVGANYLNIPIMVRNSNQRAEHKGDVITIIMELCEGGSLAQEISKRVTTKAPFTQQEVGLLFASMALGLAHLHLHRKLHRDIKPANVLLTSSMAETTSSFPLAKLSDFGLSKQVDGTISSAVATTNCGTPFAKAPELWQGTAYGALADIFSLGVCLFEVMCLTRPFAGADNDTLKASILAGTVQPVPAHVATLYLPELRELVLSMIKTKPSDRPPIANILQVPLVQEFIKDLRDKISAKTMLPNISDEARKQALEDIDTTMAKAKQRVERDTVAARAVTGGENWTDHDINNAVILKEGPVLLEVAVGDGQFAFKEQYAVLTAAALSITARKDTEDGLKSTRLENMKEVDFFDDVGVCQCLLNEAIGGAVVIKDATNNAEKTKEWCESIGGAVEEVRKVQQGAKRMKNALVKKKENKENVS